MSSLQERHQRQHGDPEQREHDARRVRAREVEGLEAVLTWVDTELKAARTVCMIGLENAASFKLAERVGYRPYGEALYHGNTVTLLERPNGGVASH